MQYNKIERHIAKALDHHPLLRMAAKAAYQRLSYFFCRDTQNRMHLHADCKLSGIDGDNKKHVQTFFGYYDKSPWSDCGRYYLCHLFINRDSSRIGLGICETQNTSIRRIGFSHAFNFQQGAMLQWLRDGTHRIIFNDMQNGVLVAKIMDPFTEKITATIQTPIQTVNTTADEALTLNYKRLDKIRPEYGYAAPALNYSADMDYEKDGIWKIDLRSGRVHLILTIKDLMDSLPRKEMKGAAHKINHIMYSPSGNRFVFMHRWIGPTGKYSRLFTANSDGSELCLLADDQMVSHYCWRDDGHLLAWARREPIGDRYFLFEDRSTDYTIVGDGILNRYGDGHPSYSPNSRWIVTDTYPDKARMRYLLLYDILENDLVILGKFFAPWKYDGPARCDLHPRWSPDGKQISIDSVHEGIRRSYFIDVSRIVAR